MFKTLEGDRTARNRRFLPDSGRYDPRRGRSRRAYGRRRGEGRGGLRRAQGRAARCAGEVGIAPRWWHEGIAGPAGFVVGAGLLASPWWSKTLPAADYPLVIVPGAIFATFGAVCGAARPLAALAHAGVDAVHDGVRGHVRGADVHAIPSRPRRYVYDRAAFADSRRAGRCLGGRGSSPAFFAIVCLGTAALGVRGACARMRAAATATTTNRES